MSICLVQQQITQGLKKKRLSAAGASRKARGNPNLIKNVMKGHMPRLDSLIRIATVLEIDFHIDPTRSVETSPEISRSLGLPTGATLKQVIDKIEQLTGEVVTSTEIIQEIRAVRDAVVPQESSSTRQVEVRELAAAAGGGAMELDETVRGYVAFRRDWLDRTTADPTQCTVISVTGDSMDPTLADGSKILVDRGQRRLRQGRIYVVRTSGGLVVKRVARNRRGIWLMQSDNDAHPDRPWPEGAEVIGEVKWVGRTL